MWEVLHGDELPVLKNFNGSLPVPALYNQEEGSGALGICCHRQTHHPVCQPLFRRRTSLHNLHKARPLHPSPVLLFRKARRAPYHEQRCYRAG